MRRSSRRRVRRRTRRSAGPGDAPDEEGQHVALRYEGSRGNGQPEPGSLHRSVDSSGIEREANTAVFKQVLDCLSEKTVWVFASEERRGDSLDTSD
jgi:hypothetical protein